MVLFVRMMELWTKAPTCPPTRHWTTNACKRQADYGILSVVEEMHRNMPSITEYYSSRVVLAPKELHHEKDTGNPIYTYTV